jgi:hypothetical protein
VPQSPVIPSVVVTENCTRSPTTGSPSCFVIVSVIFEVDVI